MLAPEAGIPGMHKWSCIPRNTVGSNYLPLREIPASSKISCRQGWDAYSNLVTTLLRDKQYPIHILCIIYFNCYKKVHHFKKWAPGATDMRQLRSSHSSYDQAYPAVTINDLFPGVTVTINLPKFSCPDICNIKPCHCSFSHPKNQSVPWLSPCALWTTNEVHVDTIRESLNSLCSASTILIDLKCAWS